MPYPYYPNYNNWSQPNTVPMPNVQMPVAPTQPQQNNADINWVQGEADAKSRPVASGHSVIFMDTEDTVMYIKTVDQSGMPQPLRIFDYKERTQVGTNRGQSGDKMRTDSVTRQEFDALAEKVEHLIKGEGEG